MDKNKIASKIERKHCKPYADKFDKDVMANSLHILLPEKFEMDGSAQYTLTDRIPNIMENILLPLQIQIDEGYIKEWNNQDERD